MEDIDPIEPWIPGKTPASQMLWMSDAFAEAAAVLCKALVEDDFQRQHTNTRVILHLCRHAFELFLKGAISAKTGASPPITHRLDRLHAEYTACYPDEKHLVDAPFTSQVLESAKAGLFPDSLDEYQKSHDQRYRYPADAAGRAFEESDQFDVQAHLVAIEEFRSQINFMVFRIDRNYWD